MIPPPLLRGLAVVSLGSAFCGAAQAAEFSSAPYGVTANGEAIDAFTLKNSHGMSVRILNYGGIINEVRAPDRNGRCDNVVLALPDLRAYENRANFSSIVGRYANRISGGGFVLDGRRYDLKSNAEGITSHGGAGGYGARRWHAAGFAASDVAGVVLHDLSFDGENGFPGNVSMAVKFSLTQERAAHRVHRNDRPADGDQSQPPCLFQPGQWRRDLPASHRSFRRSLHTDQ